MGEAGAAARAGDGGVELVCIRTGGKLRVHALSDGYDPTFNVQFPRDVREEGVHYVVDGLEKSNDGTFYRAIGAVRRLQPGAGSKAASSGANGSAAPLTPGDPLALAELFAGGGEPWMPLLKPTIEAQPEAATFIGPNRDKAIVPVRELTFQALKPNPPEKWKVVAFGQNPYPRVESATGIAMFDNQFNQWSDGRFGAVTSIRCIIKAAAMWKHGIKKDTPVADIRALLAKHAVVPPPEWFGAMLTQGVLLLNTALTASTDVSMSTSEHTRFWRPVVEKIVEEILRSKQSADDKNKGVVFAWWGNHAKALRKVVEKLQKKYPGVPVRHLDHCNPAAMGHAFCNGNHFAAINSALASLGMDEVDWLPSTGWNGPANGDGAPDRFGDAGRMGDFITRTMELHKLYLDRLQGVKDEGRDLPSITGLLATPPLPFPEAMAPVVERSRVLDFYVKDALGFGRKQAAASATAGLSEHEIAALHLYTTGSPFYRELNAALRDSDRSKVAPYFGYLRLVFSALYKLTPFPGSLWRGVAADLRAQYPSGGTVTWWGVSSCTADRSVAEGFLGMAGRRMLFEVTKARAVGIRHYSAFTGEEEYVLAPGTRLKVVDVKNDPCGLCTVRLEELADQRLVS